MTGVPRMKAIISRMNTFAPTTSDSVARRPARIGAVSFVNTLPLIDGLQSLRDTTIQYSVPSLLLDQLLHDEVDLALCSSIDYQRSSEPLWIVPVGLLGCRGATLTVRLYSRRPIAQLETVYCDTDSHTSVALLSILLHEQFDIQPKRIDYNAREHVADSRPVDWPEAMLLIGDKVVTDSPPAVRYPHQLDLGQAWREHTGLPFVFATWMARQSTDTDVVRRGAAALDRQRRQNLHRIEDLIHLAAARHRWPKDLAGRYLTEHLWYTFTDEALQSLELFYKKAHALALIDRIKPIELFEI